MKVLKMWSVILTGCFIIIMLFAFTRTTTKDSGITFRKHIESTDPPCLQMYYFIELYADSFNIPKKYAYGIAHAETGYDGPFDWRYDHKQTSSVNAVGPMQVMLATARWVNKDEVSINKLKVDIRYNVRTSMKLLSMLYGKYHDWKSVFCAYNTGKPGINAYAVKVHSYEPSWTIN
jgi:soluble lytic murein transglycosylase-like protein